MVTTRWKDTKATCLTDVINTMLDAKSDDVGEKGFALTNWVITKSFEDNHIITLNNKCIEYNLLRYTCEEIIPGNASIDDRTMPRDGAIIIYSINGAIYYIIDKNSGAMSLLRKLNSYSGKNEIVKNSLDTSSDFFIWLISKVYRGENTISSESTYLPDLLLDAIKLVKGDTEDLSGKVSVSGESLINIISTLSFLLESKNLNQVTVDLAYGHHENIQLILNSKGVLSTNIKYYQGSFEEEIEDELLCKLYLMIYMEIMPILMQNYFSDITEGVWSKEENIEFLKLVGTDLSKKIEKRVTWLEESIS